MRLLTDPVFDPAGTRYVHGPIESLKQTNPALALAEIGSIDAILLSHDQHNDNLDQAGLTYLPQAGCVLTTPAGAQRLGGNAQGRVATWKTTTLVGADSLRVHVTATPARHGPPELEEANSNERAPGHHHPGLNLTERGPFPSHTQSNSDRRAAGAQPADASESDQRTYEKIIWRLP